MGAHDNYGKRVMRRAVGNAYDDWGAPVQIDYGRGEPARIDGTVENNIAVEIESRVSKQVRGAVLDLICHRYRKKLLVLLPVHMSDAKIAAAQCRQIMSRFLPASDFRVIVLEGNGSYPVIDTDAERVLEALRELGFGAQAQKA